jgi:O-antigen ligase
MNEHLPKSRATTLLWVPLGCIWLLTLITFSAPGRDGPSDAGSLDLIALAKLATRGLVCAALCLTLARVWNQPRRQLVLRWMGPFALFVLWSILSVGWSPLRSVSAGQAASLLVQVLLVATLALLLRSPEDTSRLLFHLNCSLLAVAVVILATHAVSPEMSGLVRGGELEGSLGIVHPTSAGATASLGLMLLVGCRLLWDWSWPRRLLLPGLFLHGLLIVLAASRTALLLALPLLLVMILVYASRRLVATAILAITVAGTIYLLVDPRLELVDRITRMTEEYVSRGESAESMSSLTGRDELWEAIWVEFHASPWRGHGYFVTSRDGLLDVWSGPANRTAHNVVLQVMVTTGLIGLGLFAVGWLWMTPALWHGLRKDPESRKLGGLLLLIALWYIGWGQLCESFMGPIQPESVVFFSLVGLALAQAPLPRCQAVHGNAGSGNSTSSLFYAKQRFAPLRSQAELGAENTAGGRQ